MSDQKSGTGRLTPERRRIIEEHMAKHRKSGLLEIVSDMEALMAEIDYQKEAIADKRRHINNKLFDMGLVKAKRSVPIETRGEQRMDLHRKLRQRINEQLRDDEQA